VKKTTPNESMRLRLRGRVLHFPRPVMVMGIVTATLTN
jgi:hypothetical protein